MQAQSTQKDGIGLLDYGPTDFVTASASHANAVSLFEPAWVCRIPVPGLKSGSMNLFTNDKRPGLVAEKFGSIAGWKVLELGSFEGAHTHALESLGADVLGIEANPYIFMRALVAKNILGMRARFLLGDFVKHLQDNEARYDLVFCCGVLYHMQNPVELLYQISQHSDRVFIWTHYVTDAAVEKWKKASDYEGHGYACRYYRYDYEPNRSTRSYGGVAPFCHRLAKADIVGALRQFGFTKVDVLSDVLDHPGGPAINLIASRS